MYKPNAPFPGELGSSCTLFLGPGTWLAHTGIAPMCSAVIARQQDMGNGKEDHLGPYTGTGKVLLRAPGPSASSTGNGGRVVGVSQLDHAQENSNRDVPSLPLPGLSPLRPWGRWRGQPVSRNQLQCCCVEVCLSSACQDKHSPEVRSGLQREIFC